MWLRGTGNDKDIEHTEIDLTESKGAEQGYLKSPLHKSNERTGEIVKTNYF